VSCPERRPLSVLLFFYSSSPPKKILPSNFLHNSSFPVTDAAYDFALPDVVFVIFPPFAQTLSPFACIIGYWHGLGSECFSGRKQANCLEVIRADIVDIWNLPDKDKYLSSKAFKDEISYFIQELSSSPAHPLSTATAAAWLEDTYQNNQENICCVMGYIVDLSVILCGIFASVSDVSPFGVQSVIKEFVDSGLKADIHSEVRSFVGAAQPSFTYRDGDLFLEKIVGLIRCFCVPPSVVVIRK